MLVKAAKVGLVVGALLAAVAAYTMFKGPDAIPTCDGRQMAATDTCITHYADGHTVTQTYAQAKGHSDAALAGLLLIGGLAVGGASLYGWQRSRRGPQFEFAGH